MRPVYSIASAYPRLVDANRAPAYAPVDGQVRRRPPTPRARPGRPKRARRSPAQPPRRPGLRSPRPIHATRPSTNPTPTPLPQKPSVPLGYIPEVRHTYAYWDLNYALANEKARPRGAAAAHFSDAPAPACAAPRRPPHPFHRSSHRRLRPRLHFAAQGVAMGESTCAARTIGFPPTMPGGKARLSSPSAPAPPCVPSSAPLAPAPEPRFLRGYAPEHPLHRGALPHRPRALRHRALRRPDDGRPRRAPPPPGHTRTRQHIAPRMHLLAGHRASKHHRPRALSPRRLFIPRRPPRLPATAPFRPLQVQYGYFNTESGTPDKFSYLGSSECLIVGDAEEARAQHRRTKPSRARASHAASSRRTLAPQPHTSRRLPRLEYPPSTGVAVPRHLRDGRHLRHLGGVADTGRPRERPGERAGCAEHRFLGRGRGQLHVGARGHRGPGRRRRADPRRTPRTPSALRFSWLPFGVCVPLGVFFVPPRAAAARFTCSRVRAVACLTPPRRVRQGFYDPSTDGDFDFTAAYGYFNSSEMHLGAPPGHPTDTPSDPQRTPSINQRTP